MKTFPTCKEKKNYLVKIVIVQVLQGRLGTIHLRFVIGTNKKYCVVIIDRTFLFQIQKHFQHAKGKKYLSQSIYCVSSTILSSYNSFKVHVPTQGTSKEYCVLIFKTNQVQY